MFFSSSSQSSGDAIQKPARANGNQPPMAPVRTSSVLTSRAPTINTTTITSALSSSLNKSLNNILNYSPPQYMDKNNVTKSTTSIASNNQLNAMQSGSNGDSADIKVATTSTNGHSSSNGASNEIYGTTGRSKNNSSNDIYGTTGRSKNGTSNEIYGTTGRSNSALNKIYGTSLLCYQNVSPPSPTASIVHDNGNDGIVADSSNDKTASEETKSAKDSKSSSDITLSALIPGDTTTLPVAVKKRSKLRHRFSDVGSWGLRKKDRAHKYRSMNIESVEVLGDPVIEDIFFVSSRRFIIFASCLHFLELFHIFSQIFTISCKKERRSEAHSIFMSRLNTCSNRD